MSKIITLLDAFVFSLCAYALQATVSPGQIRTKSKAERSCNYKVTIIQPKTNHKIGGSPVVVFKLYCKKPNAAQKQPYASPHFVDCRVHYCLKITITSKQPLLN